MKKSFTVLFLPLALLASGCSQESAPDISARGTGLSISAHVMPSTRLSEDVNYNSGFEVGDAIGVFAVSRTPDGEPAFPSDEGNYIHNAKFVYRGDGQWEEEGSKSYYPLDGNVLDFYAYYPYSEETDPTCIRYDAGKEMYDFMMSRREGVESGETAELYFRHVLALAEAYIVGADKLSGYSVTMNGVVTSAEFSFAAPEGEELTGAGTDVSDVDMKRLSNMFRAYLPPQKITKGTGLFSVSDDGGNFVHEAAYDSELVQGSVKKWLVSEDNGNPELYSNSYVADPGSTIYIPVSKVYAMWEKEELLDASQLAGEQETEVSWTDERYILNNDQLTLLGNGKDAVIQVRTTPGVEGNALVSLKVGGKIRWSWHLWITFYDPESPDGQVSSGDYIFMDRNLGAFSDEPGNPAAMGLQYQWGRNVPFPCPEDFESTVSREVWNGFGQKVSFLQAAAGNDESENIGLAVSEPTVVIFGPQEPHDWMSKQENFRPYRWISENGEKSGWDPCPEGWQVPPAILPFENLSAGSAGWNFGLYWSDAGYWPAAGLNEGSGQTWNGQAGYYWSSEADPNKASLDAVVCRAYGFQIDSYFANSKYSIYKHYPFNVRCVKQK